MADIAVLEDRAQGLSDCVVRSNRDLVNVGVGGCFVAAVTNGNTELVGSVVVNEEHVCVPVNAFSSSWDHSAPSKAFSNLVSSIDVCGINFVGCNCLVVFEVPDSNGKVLDSGVGKSNFIVQVVFRTTRADGTSRVLNGNTQAQASAA